MLSSTPIPFHTYLWYFIQGKHIDIKQQPSPLVEDITFYTYDPNGNLLTVTDGEGTTTYTYNARNQQVGYTAGLTSASYTYNPDGLRRTKTTTGMPDTQYIWSGGNMVYECELLNPAAGTVYVYGVNLLSSRSTSGNKRYYLYNAHGDVVQLLNSTKTIVKSYKYDAFGVEYNIDPNDPNPFRYCGEYFDKETGTYYLRARYYDPSSGIFIAEDPVRDGLNWYTYCYNNPLFYIDPWGLIPTAEEAALMAEHIYKATEKDINKNLGDDFGGWVFEGIYYEDSLLGIKMGVYSRTSDGSVEYALVNRGTDNWLSMQALDNVSNAASGGSIGLFASASKAQKFVNENKDYEITMVGHSKGGAEAIANALMTNTACITFNPAPINMNSISWYIMSLVYDKQMTHYVVNGEILNSLFGSPTFGKTVYLKPKYTSPWWHIWKHPGDASKNHQMEVVLWAITNNQYK